MADPRQTEFLTALQNCIDRYKPLLEEEFAVSLGPVEAKPLRIRAVLSRVYAKSMQELQTQIAAKQGHPPMGIRKLLLRLEMACIWVPACVLLYIRYWYPALVMKWQSDPPTVLVSFFGWSEADYGKNKAKLDQWAVHEMAHGVWSRLAQDCDDEHSRRWRLWNEGFAHYLADEHMRSAYGSEATIHVEWSDFRQQGKRLVEELVHQHGKHVLKRIPTQWQEFDSNETQASEISI